MGWQLDEANDAMDRYEQKIGDLGVEIERLQKFVRHRTWCDFMTFDPYEGCSCGLVVALKGK